MPRASVTAHTRYSPLADNPGQDAKKIQERKVPEFTSTPKGTQPQASALLHIALACPGEPALAKKYGHPMPELRRRSLLCSRT